MNYVMCERWFFVYICCLCTSITTYQDSIARNYVVISLGYRCQVAQQMVLNDIRSAAYPFDWLITSFESVYSLIENKFEGFLSKENLELRLNIPYQDDYGFFNVPKYPHVLDKKYNVLFRHDFKYDKNFLDDYDAVKEKYARRIKRLYETLSSGNFVYFIRHILSRREAEQLVALFDKMFPELRYCLVVVDHNEEIKKDWNLPKVKNFYLRLPEPYWRDGDNDAWKMIFLKLGLINSDVIDGNYDSKIFHQQVANLYDEK